MLPPLDLPTDPTKQFYMREATAAECIDFADVDPAREEELTTRFLNTVQAPENFIDAKTLTAQTRRLFLLWYWLHTVKDPHIVLPYDCTHCGEKHHWDFDMQRLLDEYRAVQGKPEREIEWKGEMVKVVPLTGEDMHVLEMMRLDHDLASEKNIALARKKAALLRLERIMRTVRFVTDSAKTPEEQSTAREKRFLAMPMSDFEDMAEKVLDKLTELDHGIPTVYDSGRIYLLTPPHQCPNSTDSQEVTRLRIPFRSSDYIPGL